MNSGRIKIGMLGGGNGAFIGIVHRIAIYMSERYHLIGGAFNVDHQSSLAFAQDMELDTSRIYADVVELIQKENELPESERMEVVSIITPNFLHFDMAAKLLEGGFHVICEKPMTMTAAEADRLEALVNSTGKQFCLTHTYTGYPMVRQMKEMITNGNIGTIQRIDVQYYQGWINPFIHDKEKRKEIWRLDPEKSGISCCMGDIGLHGFNLIEYTTNLKVKEVLADLNYLYDDNPLDVDGTVLLRFENGIKGVLRTSQVATAEENNLSLQVYGRKGALKWSQENPTVLTWLQEGQPSKKLKPGNAYNSYFAQESTKMAPGHPEGIFDAMGNIYKGMAKAIRREKNHDGDFPTVREGVRGMHFIETVVESHLKNNIWLKI